MDKRTKFLRLPEVCKRVGLSKSTIYALIHKKDFPEPIKITQRVSAWIEANVDEWMAEKISNTKGGLQ